MMREKTVRAAAARRLSVAGDRPPRYDSQGQTLAPTVVRGPVPRLRWRRKNLSSGP